jgi:hypothetical protein
MPRRIVMVAISIHGVCEVVGLEMEHYKQSHPFMPTGEYWQEEFPLGTA